MILTLLIAAAAAQAPEPLKTFKDWTVGCDNGLACHATSLMPEGGDWDTTIGLSIQRGPEATAEPAITLLAEGGIDYRLRTEKGQIIRFVARSVRPDYRLDPRDLPILLAALRGDSNLRVEDAAGKRLGAIPLAGVSAAMLYMDEQQHRIGTVTALVRPGSKPAASVPTAPPVPVIRSSARRVKGFTVPASTIAGLRKRYECEAEDPDWPGYDASQHVLDDSHVLILLGCGAGAYNYSSIPLIAVKGDKDVSIRPATFDQPPGAGDAAPMLINAGWDDESGVLGSFAKGRGLGDCGAFADYVWDGRRLRLVSMSEMDECRGSQDYITTWRTRVVQ